MNFFMAFIAFLSSSLYDSPAKKFHAAYSDIPSHGNIQSDFYDDELKKQIALLFFPFGKGQSKAVPQSIHINFLYNFRHIFKGERSIYIIMTLSCQKKPSVIQSFPLFVGIASYPGLHAGGEARGGLGTKLMGIVLFDSVEKSLNTQPRYKATYKNANINASEADIIPLSFSAYLQSLTATLCCFKTKNDETTCSLLVDPCKASN